MQKRKEEGGVVEEKEKVEMAVGAAIGNSGRLTFSFSSAIHVVPQLERRKRRGFHTAQDLAVVGSINLKNHNGYLYINKGSSRFSSTPMDLVDPPRGPPPSFHGSARGFPPPPGLPRPRQQKVLQSTMYSHLHRTFVLDQI